MRLEKHCGLVLYSFPLGEADQIITCFTDSGSLVKFVAKGSRKSKSRFAAAVQLFNFAEFVIYTGKGLPILRQADILESFPQVRKDWTKTGASLAAIELCRLLILEEAEEVDVFDLVLRYLKHLKSNTYCPLTYDWFRLELVRLLGYQMSFGVCVSCGQPASKARLVWPEGGTVCIDCGTSPGSIYNSEQLRILDLLQRSPRDKALEPYAPMCAKVVDSLIFWLTDGKTKAQAFRYLFEKANKPRPSS